MSNLLEVIRLRGKAAGGKGNVPLMVDDISVDPETAPYLVSSSKGFAWIERAHPGNKIKAAVRNGAVPGDLFREVIEQIAARGAKDEWGNVCPFTAAGLAAAVDHLTSYGLLDVEVLVPPVGKDRPARPDWLSSKAHDWPVRPCSWLPDGWAVVVPRDRAFVGILGHVTVKDVVVVVHNASRGVAVLRGG